MNIIVMDADIVQVVALVAKKCIVGAVEHLQMVLMKVFVEVVHLLPFAQTVADAMSAVRAAKLNNIANKVFYK